MKTIIALLTAVALAPAMISCAAFQRGEAESAEQLLAAAGFRQVPADTKERIDALQTMKPRTVTLVNRNGKMLYMYPDPTNCNCLYVGTPANYSEYQRLVLEKQLVQEQVTAEETGPPAVYDVWGHDL